MGARPGAAGKSEIAMIALVILLLSLFGFATGWWLRGVLDGYRIEELSALLRYERESLARRIARAECRIDDPLGIVWQRRAARDFSGQVN